jgi:hypothetical protein
MPRGGTRQGAGRKPRLLRYYKQNRRKRIGTRALQIGQRCEELWRQSYKTNFSGWHSIGEKRPRTHKRIMRQVAAEFDETVPMVERCWDDYRRLEADLREDLSSV